MDRKFYLVYLIVLLHELPRSQSQESLTAAEKVDIVSFWNKIEPTAAELGAEALERALLTFPYIQNFFKDLDLSHGSADLLAYGRKIMKGIGKAVKDLNSPHNPPFGHKYLHVKDVRLYQDNFMILAYSMQEAFKANFPNDFTDEVQAAWDHFLTILSSDLTSKK